MRAVQAEAHWRSVVAEILFPFLKWKIWGCRPELIGAHGCCQQSLLPSQSLRLSDYHRGRSFPGQDQRLHIRRSARIMPCIKLEHHHRGADRLYEPSLQIISGRPSEPQPKSKNWQLHGNQTHDVGRGLRMPYDPGLGRLWSEEYLH